MKLLADQGGRVETSGLRLRTGILHPALSLDSWVEMTMELVSVVPMSIIGIITHTSLIL